MNQQIPHHLLSQYKTMGFSEYQINEGWKKCKGNTTILVDVLTQTQNQGRHIVNLEQQPQMRGDLTQEEIQLNQALMMQVDQRNFEIDNPQQRMRKSGVPVGLKNIGNSKNFFLFDFIIACYFNCLLQAYFNNYQFVKLILEHKFQELKQLSKQQKQSEVEEYNRKFVIFF